MNLDSEANLIVETIKQNAWARGHEVTGVEEFGSNVARIEVTLTHGAEPSESTDKVAFAIDTAGKDASMEVFEGGFDDGMDRINSLGEIEVRSILDGSSSMLAAAGWAMIEKR